MGHSSQPKIFVISDTHFNHKKMATVGRPKNFKNLIIKNWNNLVRKEDIVIHLGDVIFSKQSELKTIMEKLNGVKILVRGNHDHERNYYYIRRGFNFCCDAMKLKDVYFTHEPIKKLPVGCNYNVHGHLHNCQHREFKLKKFHRLINIENTLSPVLLDSIVPKPSKILRWLEKF